MEMSTIVTDPADLACLAFDTAAASAPTANAVSEAWGRRAELRALADRILDEGTVDPTSVSVETAGDALIALFALDLALQEVTRDLAASTGTSALPAIAVRLVRTGRLDSGNAPGGGALLAKRTQRARPGPPDYIHEALTAIVRVPDEIWSRVAIVIPRAGHDLEPRLRVSPGCW